MTVIALLMTTTSMGATIVCGVGNPSPAGPLPPMLMAAWYWPFGSSESHKQLQAANERIKDLTKLISEREARIKELQAECASAKAQAAAALQQASEKHKEEIERLKAAHDDELAAKRGVCEQRIAALQTEKSEVEMRLSDSEKQRLALQGLIDQPARLKIIQEGNRSIERTIWVCLVVAALAMSGLFASQFLQLRAKRREDIVRLIGHLSEQSHVA